MKFDKKKLLTWALYFLIFFAVLQFFNKPKQQPPELTANPIAVSPTKSEFVSGEEVTVTIRNNTTIPITIPSNCPKNPLKVLAWTGEKFEERSAETKLKCDGVSYIAVAPNAESKITYTYWNYSLFGNPGRYKVEVAVHAGTTTGVFTSPEFTVTEASAWRKFFRTVFYQPLYNILVFFVSIAPGRDLGLAIILLTLLIRLILLIPSQKAIVSQRRMQELQPKLEHIKKKYTDNKERVAQETMQLWKEHKVNPMGSCLPILIQFPVLIALFYVIQNGLNPDNVHLLYNPLKDVDLSNIHTNFLGILDLTKINTFVLPLIVGALQFFQLKLTNVKKKPGEEKTQASEMQSATKMMTYIMPVMIALFTASVPAGVGLYWGVSTVFALGQQVVANRKSVIKS